MKHLKDLTGQRFDRLVVICREGRDKRGSYLWKCICDCGKIYFAVNSHLLRGGLKSCGCLRIENRIKHGNSPASGASKEYNSWKCIKARCLNPNNPEYHNYGGRGITICDRWKNSFANFLEDMGAAPSEIHSVDRYPNMNGNYEPGNCRWATPKEQARNTRGNVFIQYNGETLCIMDWANRIGLSFSGVMYHLRNGKTIEQIIAVRKMGNEKFRNNRYN
jgi:hypothetical protein